MKKNRKIIRQKKLERMRELQLASHNQSEANIANQDNQIENKEKASNYDLEKVSIGTSLQGFFDFYYISDIHIDGHVDSDMDFETKKQIAINRANEILEQYTNNSAYLLIAGDLVRDIKIAKCFYELLITKINPSHIVVILGNHELWDVNYKITKNTFDTHSIVRDYRQMFNDLGIVFLNDDLLIVKSNNTVVVTKEELLSISLSDLQHLCNNNAFMIYGSMGGLRNNDDYAEENSFTTIYKKISNCLRKEKLICLNHYPLNIDWQFPLNINWQFDFRNYEKNWIYVFGHTHKNFFISDEDKTIYADNQIVSLTHFFLKSFSLYNGRYKNFFSEFIDGIHNISHREYQNLYSQCGQYIEFNRDEGDIYIVKKGSFAMFFLKSEKSGKTYLLQGGRPRIIENTNLDYYYKNLETYGRKCVEIIAPYEEALHKIAREVKSIGGNGYVHGCIVDVDFFEHIYLNPFDFTLTAYKAYDTLNRHVYKNVPSLLKYNCKQLYRSYEKMLQKGQEGNSNNLIIKRSQELSKDTIYDNSPIYQISTFIKNIQYVYDCGVVRSWDENILKKGNNNYLNYESLVIGQQKNKL